MGEVVPVEDRVEIEEAEAVLAELGGAPPPSVHVCSGLLVLAALLVAVIVAALEREAVAVAALEREPEERPEGVLKEVTVTGWNPEKALVADILGDTDAVAVAAPERDADEAAVAVAVAALEREPEAALDEVSVRVGVAAEERDAASVSAEDDVGCTPPAVHVAKPVPVDREEAVLDEEPVAEELGVHVGITGTDAVPAAMMAAKPGPVDTCVV